MSNEDELNPNIPPNNESSNTYSESIDTTQNTTASLFPGPSFNTNNEIESEQNNELSNLFQNGTNSSQINDINELSNSNESSINNYSAASSLFNNTSENQNEQQQAVTNNQQYYNETGDYTNQGQQFYQPQQNFAQQPQETIQQNSFNEQPQLQHQPQDNFIHQQQQQPHESFIPQQTQESFTQQQQSQESYIQQQQHQNLIQQPPQQQFQQQSLYQQYQQPYYSPASNQTDPYGNSVQPPPPQQHVQPQHQSQTAPYGIFVPPNQIHQGQSQSQQQQQQQQFEYPHHSNITNSYSTQQPQQEQPKIQHFASAPVKVGVHPPPKGPSPTYFTPLSPSNPRNQQQPFSPKKVFVPGSTASQQGQAPTQQRQPTYGTTQNQVRQTAAPPPSPQPANVAPREQQSPRSPGAKHGPVFIAPYIPGQSSPSKAATSVQVQKEAETAKFRPPPPIAQQPKTQQNVIQPPPPNTYTPPNVQQKRDEGVAQFQRPPPMTTPGQQQTATVQNQQKPLYQPPPQIARPPPPSSKAIYVPGQGRVGPASDSEKQGENETAKQPQFVQPPAVPQPPQLAQTPTVQQPQKPSSQFTQPPAVPQFAQPPAVPQPQKPSSQFAQPPPMPATKAAYVPGQSGPSTSSRQPYVPGMNQQPKDDEDESKAATSQDVKKTPAFFTPHDSSASGPSFMRPPPMPVAIPVGIPVTHSPEEDDQKTQKKRRKRKSKVKSPTNSLSDSKQEDKKTFEPSPIPHFMTPEAVAERGGALPHSQTTGNVSFDDKSDYEYYEYDNEEGVKHSVSAPNSVVPISQFTGVYEPFFTKKKPLSALGFGGIVLTRQKEGKNENENDADNAKKSSNFVNIINISENSEIEKIETFEQSTTDDEKLEFASNQISSSKDEEEKLLWSAVRVFISNSAKTFSEEQTSTDSVLREFRENLKKEGTEEFELIKILSSASTPEEDKETNEQETTETDSKSDEDKDRLLEEVQKRIVESGEESALEYAIEKKIWPIALIISSSLSQETTQKTISKYIDAELKGQKEGQFKQLSNVLSIISGSESFTASEWKSQLKEILLHLTPLSQKTSLIKMASVLESNKLNCASIACHIIANLQLATQISFFNSSKMNSKANNRQKAAQKLLDEFDSFIVSLLKKSPHSAISMNVANILASQKVDEDDEEEDEYRRKMKMNLALLRASAQADLGFEEKSKENLKSLNCDNDKNGLLFAKRLLSVIDGLNEKASEESLKFVPLRKEDVPPPPPKQESEKSNFFVPMAAFIPGLGSQSPIQPQAMQNTQKVQQGQPSFFTPNQTAAAQPSNQPSFYPTNTGTQRSNAINFYPKDADYDNADNEDREYNNNNANNNSNSTGGSSENRPNASGSDSQNKSNTEKQQNGEKKPTPAPEGQTQQKRGWFSNIFSKLNPFGSSSKIVDLNEHDNGEMVWNGHRYVMKGHENDEANQGLPPPPPKGLAPALKTKSSPFPMTEPLPPPTHHHHQQQQQQQQPPPPLIGGPVVGPTPPGGAAPGSGSTTGPPIGAVAPVGRTRVSKRYVANF